MSDAFYTSLEDKFRGARSEIVNRLRVYLPFVLPVAKLSPDAPIVDLGCGRGEWLELMQEHGLSAKGIDTNALSVESCINAGFNAVHADAMDVLDGMEENSAAVITGFHIAEHLPFDALLELCSKAIRALIPGGLLILETPNPENILVGSHNFYLDPSHKHPLPPLLLDHLFDHIGFDTRKTLRLQEPATSENSDTLNDRLQSVSPDYALVGKKSGSKPHDTALRDAFKTHIGASPAESQLAAPIMPTDILDDIRTSLMGSETPISLPSLLNQLSQDMLIGQARQKTEAEHLQAALSDTSAKQEHAAQKLNELEIKLSEQKDKTTQGLAALTMQLSDLATQSERQQNALTEKSEIITRQDNHINAQDVSLTHMRHEKEHFEQIISSQTRELENVQQIISSQTRELENVQQQFQILKNERDQTVTSLHAIVKSTSWRITKPLRFISRLLKSPRRGVYSLIRNLDHSLQNTPKLRTFGIGAAKRLGVTRETLTQNTDAEPASLLPETNPESSPWVVRPPLKRTEQWLKQLGPKS